MWIHANFLACRRINAHHHHYPFYGYLIERRLFYPLHQFRSASLFTMQRQAYRFFFIANAFPSQLIFNFSYLFLAMEKNCQTKGWHFFFHLNISKGLASYLFKFWNGEHFFWPNQMNISKIIRAKGFQCETNWM